jgi:glycosyltransferase involved in cell wall biosynthesis
LRIAQVSPLYESVPPRLYGGTERIVSYLTEELVNQGHDVTLFASGDSVTKAELVPISETSLRLNEECIDQFAHHVLMIEKVLRAASEFDIIHWHIDYFHFPFSRRHTAPHVTTLHGRLDIPDLIPLYQEFPEMPVISISDDQRAPLPWANWVGTVHHGLPEDLYSFHEGPGKYLAFLGRISPEKRVDRAIEIAKQLDTPIKIAAKVDDADRDYFEQEIEHLLDHPLVEFIGEIGEEEKEEFLGNACALLFPIDWPEPFGLVMIEAMACGTPVVALRRGSVPEVLDHGITGFICDSMDEAAEATQLVQTLDRRRCREVFEARFSAARMARDYVKIYERLIRKAVEPAVLMPLNGYSRPAPYPLEEMRSQKSEVSFPKNS